MRALLLNMRTGYEISPEDFVRLCTEAKEEMLPLLRAWFNIGIQQEKGRMLLRESSGNEVLPRTIHEAIQADSEKQGTVYRVAMTLWR